MTLRDVYAFSLHNIKENKSRSILTVAISAFLSLLVMALLSISISFGQNGNEVLNKTYFDENSIVSIQYQNTYYPAQNNELFNVDKYQTFLDALNRHNEVVSFVNYSTNINIPMMFTDSTYPMSIGYEIKEGRNIAPSTDSNEVIISSEYYEQDPESLKIGSKHSMMVSFLKGRTYKEAELEYVVVGIYECTNQKYHIDGKDMPLSLSAMNMIGDINIALKASAQDIYIPRVDIYYQCPSSNPNPGKIFNNIKALMADLNEVMPKRVQITSGGMEVMVDYVDPCSSTAYRDYSALDKFKAYFIIGAIVIALALMLMSIGSLANSVMISIDRSKKFIGLLKALGLKGKSLKSIIILESLTLISVGVLISYGLLFAFQVPLLAVIEPLTNAIFGGYISAIDFTVSFYAPIYILFGTLVAFALLTLLFSMGSLHKISKTDPISVISEVS